MNDKLNRIIYLNKSISEDIEKLKAINITMYDLKNNGQDITGITSGVKDNYISIDKSIDTKDIIKKRIDSNNKDLNILKKDLINRLDKVDDDLMIDIMYLRYIDFFTWSRICKILNYSRSRIFQKHNECVRLIYNSNKKD